MARELPPMPARAEVLATVREPFGPVAVVRLTDVEDELRELHFAPSTAWQLADGLFKFLRQINDGT